jgi:aryl carrier-like protein
MMPSAFVLLDALPLTANGKVDRRALPEPDYSRLELSRPYEAPRNDTERSLGAIWEELLGLARVGVRDNFFELGGNSLLATRVLSRVRRQMGLEIPFGSFFARPTIAEFAEYVDGIVWSAKAGSPLQQGHAATTDKGQL